MTEPLTLAELDELALALRTLSLPLSVTDGPDYVSVWGKGGCPPLPAVALTLNSAWVELVNAVPALIAEVRQARSHPSNTGGSMALPSREEIMEILAVYGEFGTTNTRDALQRETCATEILSLIQKEPAS